MAGVYGATLGPGLGPTGDAVKLQLVGPVLGTPHAPGYPLYVLASYAFVHLVPIGPVALRVDLLSTVLAIVALLLLYAVARRLGCRRWVAAAAAAGFGFLPTWWSHAVIAEVYTGHLAIVLGALLLLLRWHDRRAASAGDGTLPIAALAVVSLGFAHHLTIVTLVPAVALFVVLTLRRDPRRPVSGRSVGALAGLPMLAVAPYGYLFWRTARAETSYLEMQTPDLATLFWYLTGAQFRDRIFAFDLGELVTERVPLVARMALAQGAPEPIGPVGALLAAVVATLLAIGVLGLRDALRHVLLVGTALGAVVYALGYAIPDLDAYLLPAYAVGAIYAGLGLERMVARVLPSRGWLAAGATAVALAMLFAQHRPAMVRMAANDTGEWLTSVLRTLDRKALDRVRDDNSLAPVVIAPDYLGFEALQYARQIGWPDGTPPRRDVLVLTPLLPDVVRSEIATFVERHQPPPLIGAQLRATRTPASLRAYLAGSEPFISFEERMAIPPGHPVFVLGDAQRDLVEAAGLSTSAVGPGVFRVGVP